MKDKIDRLRSLYGDDDEFLFELMQKFIDDCRKDVKKIEDTYNRKDWTGLKNAAHKMLNSARIFGLDKLEEMLVKIQLNTVESPDAQKLADLVKGINEQYKIAVMEMNEFMHKNS